MEFIEILKVLFLGLIEGLTEWLPVSSTGHLLLVDELFTLNAREEFKNVFIVVVQLGAILAVVVAFFSKLFPFSFAKSETSEKGKTLVLKKDCLNLWGKVLVACVPAGVIGILFDDFCIDWLS